MTEDAIQQLTFIEQNLSSVINQKQTFQRQVFEIENALEELKLTETAYQITGPVMIKKNSKELVETLKNQKETIMIRLESLKKQENSLREQMNKIQKEVFKNN
ncbi:MAG: prefoldin subunit [Candidatus Woesearchaeota archaeon]